MKEKLFFFSIKHPLSYILLFAITVRILVATIFIREWDNLIMLFSGRNYDYYKCLPYSLLAKPWFGYCLRFVLGAFSLLTITLAYRITKIIADKTTALETAMILALLWGIPYISLPFMSVLPFAGVIATSFMLYGTLIILKQQKLLYNNEKEKLHHTSFIIAGFCLGIGFAFFYPSLIYYIGILAALLILKNWKGALMTLTGYIVAVGIDQTVVELLIFHKPFIAITEICNEIRFWTGYNIWNRLLYSASMLLISLTPPMFMMMIFGFFKVWKKYILLVFPTFITILYSIFVSDMLTFIMITTFVIAGYVGWKEFYKSSGFWTRNKWLVLTCYILFAILNIAIMTLSFI